MVLHHPAPQLFGSPQFVFSLVMSSLSSRHSFPLLNFNNTPEHSSLLLIPVVDIPSFFSRNTHGSWFSFIQVGIDKDVHI